MLQEFKNQSIDLLQRKKHGLLTNEEIAKTLGLPTISEETHRDLFAVIDFCVCSEIEAFIGNSVSTFSANQIAIRGGINSSWYNSRGIPLADFFNVFKIPIVYTYTEESEEMGQSLLKASILSVRGVLGLSIPINILYHGTKDVNFMDWLRRQDVIIHKHEPNWLEDIEHMRNTGQIRLSHLFLHQGNYIGTWQRIDIPLFINAEFCLFLDSDTIVHDRFTFQDFGLEMTGGLAASTEANENNKKRLNIGVALMNVPKLRENHRDFINFIRSHKDNPLFKDRNISDQGAYLEFYAEHLNSQEVNVILSQII